MTDIIKKLNEEKAQHEGVIKSAQAAIDGAKAKIKQLDKAIKALNS